MGRRVLSGLASNLGLNAFTLGFRVHDFECGVASLGACVDEGLGFRVYGLGEPLSFLEILEPGLQHAMRA